MLENKTIFVIQISCEGMYLLGEHSLLIQQLTVHKSTETEPYSHHMFLIRSK